MKKTLFILLSIIIFELDAQKNEIDSLENLLAHTRSNDTVKIKLLNQLAYKLWSSDIEKTLKYATEADVLSDEIKYIKGRAESKRMIGIYYWAKSDFDQALSFFKKSVEFNEILGDDIGISKSLNNVALIYTSQGNYTKAIELHHKSLLILERVGDEKGVSASLNNIGLVYYSLENFPKSLEYFHKSLVIKKEIEDEIGIVINLENIGLILDEQGKKEEALKYYYDALEKGNKIGYKQGVSNIYINLSTLYIDLKDYSKALEFARKKLKIAIEIEDEIGIGDAYQIIGLIYNIQEKRILALKITEKSLKIAIEHGLLKRQKSLHKQLSEIYVHSNDYKKAYDHYVKFKVLNDSIFNEGNVKKITTLENQYKFDKEKREIELEQQKKDALLNEALRRQTLTRNAFIIGFVLVLLLAAIIFWHFNQKKKSNLILAKSYKDVKKLNDSKDRFFTILAHDLKGPVGNIKTFLEMVISKKSNFSNEELLSYLAILQKQSSAAFNILENLLIWASSQKNNIEFKPERHKVNFAIDVNIGLLENMAMNKAISISNNTDDALKAVFDLTQITTVVRNLIANAIKFTPQKGTITINAEQNNDETIISITDTGTGMDSAQVERLFDETSFETTYGTNNEKGSGLGLKLCKYFVEQHKGKIWVESEIGKGSKFVFSIPRKV